MAYKMANPKGYGLVNVKIIEGVTYRAYRSITDPTDNIITTGKGKNKVDAKTKHLNQDWTTNEKIKEKIEKVKKEAKK